MQLRHAACCGAAMVMTAAGAARGQAEWPWIGGTGNWSDLANWTNAQVPLTPPFLPVFGGANAYTVTMDVSPQLYGVRISNPNATLLIGTQAMTVGDGRLKNAGAVRVTGTFDLTGTLENQSGGRVVVDPGGTLKLRTALNDGSVRLTGGADVSTLSLVGNSPGFGGVGELALEDETNARITGEAGAQLAIVSSHRLRGAGRVSLDVFNGGVVQADVAGKTLLIQGSCLEGIYLPGTTAFQAIGGGILEFRGQVSASLAGVRAAGGTVRLGPGAAGAGTTFSVSDGGSLVCEGGAAGLQACRLSGPLSVRGGGTLTLSQTTTNDGGITVGAGGPNADATVVLANGATLTGAGGLALGDRQRAVLSVLATGTNAAGHTISGTGRVTGTLTNNGTVRADGGAAGPLRLSNGLANAGVAQAAPGSVLELGGAVTQTGSGSVSAMGDAAVVRLLENGSISGGTITSSVDGSVFFYGPYTLNTSTLLNGRVWLAAGAVVDIAGQTLRNNGTLTIGSPAGGPDFTDVRFTGTGTVSGTGEVRLGNADTARLVSLGGVVVVEASAALSGRGRVEGGLVNNGRIEPSTVLDTGLITVGGALDQRAGGRMVMHVKGTGPGTFDRVVAQGAVSLDGGLEVVLEPPYVARAGDRVRIITGTTVNGRFSAVSPAEVPGAGFLPLRVVVVYGPTWVDVLLACQADVVAIGGLVGADGLVTGDDFVAFINGFAGDALLADITGVGGPPAGPDGIVTADDFITFINAFAFGCP